MLDEAEEWQGDGESGPASVPLSTPDARAQVGEHGSIFGGVLKTVGESHPGKVHLDGLIGDSLAKVGAEISEGLGFHIGCRMIGRLRSLLDMCIWSRRLRLVPATWLGGLSVECQLCRDGGWMGRRMRSKGAELGYLQAGEGIGNRVINAWYVVDKYMEVVVSSYKE